MTDLHKQVSILEAIAKAARDEGIDSPTSYRISDRVMLSGALGESLAFEIAEHAMNDLFKVFSDKP